MPEFKYDDTIEPLGVTIGSERYRAMPAVPATMTKDFMELFARMPPIIERLTVKDPDDDGVDESKLSVQERTERAAAKMDALNALPPEEREAKIAANRQRTEDKLSAYQEFVDLSIEGIQFLLVDEDAEKLMVRVSDKLNPIRPLLLTQVWTELAMFHLSGGKESEKAQGSGPTGDDSESSLSSDTTGGTSEASSSPESDSTNSDDGTTTT